MGSLRPLEVFLRGGPGGHGARYPSANRCAAARLCLLGSDPQCLSNAKGPPSSNFSPACFPESALFSLPCFSPFWRPGSWRKFCPYGGGNETHIVAVVWAVLAFGVGLLVFRYRPPQHRQPSFSAGVVTAAALFLLLDSACWSFTVG